MSGSLLNVTWESLRQRKMEPNRIEEAEILRGIRREVLSALDMQLVSMPTLGLTSSELAHIADSALRFIWEDLLTLANRDKAADGSVRYVKGTYKTFEAVMYYRLANTLYHCQSLPTAVRHQLARNITEIAKTSTTIEIHPGAKIGRRFAIDHGTQTVIGEMCEIGDDCYVLNNVTMGAREIGKLMEGRRHPILGNRVSVGAHVGIFGPVEIGDDVTINPHCVVTENIPSGCKVYIVNQLQIWHSPEGDGVEIYGVVPREPGVVAVHGLGLTNASLYVVDEESQPIPQLAVRIRSQCDTCVVAEFSVQDLKNKEDLQTKIENDNFKLGLKIPNGPEILLTKCRGLRRALLG